MTFTTARPQLSIVAASDANNVWIGYNGSEVLGRIYKNYLGNFYFELGRQASEFYPTKEQALTALYEITEAANARHQEQSASSFENITAGWGHTSVPGGNTRRVPNAATRKPITITKATPTYSQPAQANTPSPLAATVVIDGTTCVRTAHGCISID